MYCHYHTHQILLYLSVLIERLRGRTVPALYVRIHTQYGSLDGLMRHMGYHVQRGNQWNPIKNDMINLINRIIFANIVLQKVLK